MTTTYTIVAVILGAVLILAGMWLMKALAKRRANINRSRLKAEEVRKLREQPVLTLDSFKRKSLQPANIKEVPKGWDAVPEEVSLKPRVPHKAVETPALDFVFEHKFYGSQLTIGGVQLLTGLDRRALHRLEIIGNQVYIDNKPWEVNQGDIERIKTLLRDNRG